MSTKKAIVGQNIICGSIGIGKIIDVAPLQDGGEEFYKVTFPKEKCINYFSITNDSNYRVLSTKDDIEKAVKIFKSDFDEIEYSSTQERINSQKELLKESDVFKLAETLSLLSREKNLHAQISKPYKDSLRTFVEEVSFVLQVSKNETYKLLGIEKPKKM
ncbi:hypothetical protein HBN50_01015 [Halobacteriovorax sp. GB3]|uniref:hypothetical protein n=1 Tax=Halobacteriovorax sp. GB3 TaxID=2719615 RepID=UPI002362F10D|nr:hypothetical protein [Halobacteriovorax sp. GB3]MDD0851647.1 hypothetical protein [Halobacteriovorax sp. GB3]